MRVASVSSNLSNRRGQCSGITRMTDGKLPGNKTTVEIIDFGTAALEMPNTVDSTPAPALEITEFIEPAAAASIENLPQAVAATKKPRGLIWRACSAVLRFIGWLIKSLFGFASLILLFAV